MAAQIVPHDAAVAPFQRDIGLQDDQPVYGHDGVVVVLPIQVDIFQVSQYTSDKFTVTYRGKEAWVPRHVGLGDLLQALGATRAHIMKIFACEAAAIGLLGGLLGGLAGWLLIQGGNVFAHYKWGHIIASADIFVMPVWLFPALLIFTTLLGLGAGVYPAYRASRLDPVAALRYE